MSDTPSRHPRDQQESFPAFPLDEGALNAEELELAYLRALESLEASESVPGMELEEDAEEEIETVETIVPTLGSPTSEGEAEPESRPVNPAQIIEAVLFVGGPPLTAKKIASLFDAHLDHFVIDLHIEQLNEEYRAQNRPYEIRLGEGGYRMALLPEYESIRNRVYGIGPREVKLSQDCLEILALIAYRQPVSHQQLLECGKKNSGNLVRQLIRRELVILERSEEGPRTVAYRTTPRFLSLFGLSNLDQLPQPDDLILR